MKIILLVLLALNFAPRCYSQTDTTLNQFIELIDKVQKDKSLFGTFMYKGSKVDIRDYPEYKTTIGKFIQIRWKYQDDESFPTFQAIYHNTLGYMTRNVFNQYKASLKGYKVQKNKYCKDTFCFELKDDKKLPYILIHQITEAEIPEIK